MYKGTLSGVLFALIVDKIPLSNFFYTSAAIDAIDKYQVCSSSAFHPPYHHHHHDDLPPRLRAMTDSLMLVAGPIVFAFCCMLCRRCTTKRLERYPGIAFVLKKDNLVLLLC